jgi:methionyl-tRNA formyltransferase
MPDKKINFYLMGRKGFLVLEKLLEQYPYLINTVISAEDKNTTEDFFKEIKSLCDFNKIPFSRRSEEFLDQSSISIAVSWRWLIKKNEGQLIVLHDSLLPRYRGFNPLVSCLLNNEKEIGVTAIFSTENYDEGGIISQAKRNIDYPIKIIKVIDFISEAYIEIIMELMHKITQNIPILSYQQNEESATYSLWRDDLDYIIDWNKNSEYIKRFVDAIGYPYKYACTSVNGLKVRVKDVEVIKDVYIENRSPGKIIFLREGVPTIVCKEGLIKITDAFYEDTLTDFFPFKNFRSRFGS